MTRDQYMADVLTGLRASIEKDIGALGLKPEQAHSLLCVSKTLEACATQLRGRKIVLNAPGSKTKGQGPSPLTVEPSKPHPSGPTGDMVKKALRIQ